MSSQSIGQAVSSAIFTKSLQDVVKGVRTHKRDPKPYISKVIAECKDELRESDPFVKAQAIRKLTYLQMMGYDMSWASFYVVEVMSQPRFAHKRIGYLAACQSFQRDTEVVLLTTNLLKKEFGSMNQYDIGQAINCMANIANKDLARDLLSDTVNLMSNSKPYVRKKSVLAMYKLFVAFPQGLRLSFDKLKEKLNDEEASVVSCAVNVICELADKNPKNYLSMAPQFFRLLTTSSNNWMLIKVVKLLGSLVPEEPRLARKLLEPLATIIQNTAAKSLQYECIHTVTLALPYTKRSDGTDSKNVPQVVKLCSEHLRQFVEDPDQNLKYLGLVGFVMLMRSHPKAVVEHRELVMQCLSDEDVTIKTRALELLTGMVTKRNLEELIHKLLRHVVTAEGTYRDELIQKIIFMCSRDKYTYLSDFAWYLSVLVDLATIQGSRHGELVALQLMDVAVRVAPVRPFAVEHMMGLLLDERLMRGSGRDTLYEVLYAAAWIVGEYSTLIPGVSTVAWKKAASDINKANRARAKQKSGEGGSDSDSDSDSDDEGAPRVVDFGAGTQSAQPFSLDVDDAHDLMTVRGSVRFPKREPFLALVKTMLHPRSTNLPPKVQAVYMQNTVKVFTAACRDPSEGGADDGELGKIIDVVGLRLHVFLQSHYIEVQERSHALKHLLLSLGVLLRPPPPPEKKAAGASADDELAGGQRSDDDASDESDDDGDAKVASSAPAPAPVATMDLLGDLLGDAPTAISSSSSSSSSSSFSSSSSAALASLTSPTAAAAAATPFVPGAMIMDPTSKGAVVAAARAGYKLLSALLREKIEPVNPKAQKKVPVPSGLDLSVAVNRAAMDAVFDNNAEGDLPSVKGMELSKVSFTDFRFYNEESSMTGFGSSDYMPGMEGSGGGGYGADGGSSNWFGGKQDPEAAKLTGSLPPGSSLADSSRPQIFSTYDDQDPFYIKSGGGGGGNVNPDDVDVDDIPMRSLNLEDGEGKKGKKGKKSKKSKRERVEWNVNTDDAMPVGFMESMGDAAGKSSKKDKKDKKKGKKSAVAGLSVEEDDDEMPGLFPGSMKKKGGRGDGDDLANVDLSKPLGRDEQMHEYHHRVVTNTAPPPPEPTAKKDKKDKKEKKKEKSDGGAADGKKAKDSKSDSKKDSTKKKDSKKDAKKDTKKKDSKKKDSKKKDSKKAEAAAPSSGGGGGGGNDLLDLMGFGGSPGGASAPPPAPAVDMGMGMMGGAAAAPPPPSSPMDMLGGLGSPGGTTGGMQQQQIGGSSDALDLLGGMTGSGSGMAAAAAPDSSKGKKSKGSRSLVAGGETYEYWAPFALRTTTSGGACALQGQFKCSMDGPSLELALRVTNSGSGPAEKLMLILPGLPSGFKAGGNSSLSMLLATAPLPVGATTEEIAILNVPASLNGPVSLSGKITFMSEGDSMSLLSLGTGPQTETYAAEIVLPTCSIVTPAAISEEGYAEVISQRATQSASAKVLRKQPGGDPVAIVAGFLNCRVLMRDKKGAASLYGVFPSGDVVCVLVKLRETHVTIDIKCSQPSHASAIAKELKGVAL